MHAREGDSEHERGGESPANDNNMIHTHNEYTAVGIMKYLAKDRFVPEN